MMKISFAPSILAIALLTHAANPVFAADQIVFEADFDGGIVPSEITGPGTLEDLNGYAGVSGFAGQFLRNESWPPTPTVLTLTGLPAHTAIDLKFLLAIIDSWDGYSDDVDSPFQPDIFEVNVDGATIFSETFRNSTPDGQSYVPPGNLLSGGTDLTANPGNWDSAYDMGLDPAFLSIPHASSTLVVQWSATGDGYQGGFDESWALENIQVVLHGTRGVPDSSLGLVPVILLAGLLGCGQKAGKCKQNRSRISNG